LDTGDERLCVAMDLQDEMLAAGTHRKLTPDFPIQNCPCEVVHDAAFVDHDLDFDRDE
jgi:hypothetical protein